MSDDTFIREVNEQIRQERLQSVWQRFGKFVIAGVVVAVAATIAYVIWERYRAAEAAEDGDRYYAAVDLAAAGDTAGAVAAFEALADEGVGAYPDLARLRAASTLAASGDWSGAVERLDAVATSSAPRPLRDVAAIRAGYLLVDHGTPDDVRQRVERLTNEAEPLRHPAREALGLSLWKAGQGDAARPFFQQIVDDLSAPGGLRQRAELMLGVIDAGTTIPAPAAAAADAPADAPLAPSLPAPGALEAPSAPAPEAGAVDVPPAPATADPALETPLADQLDLPDADAAPAAPAAEPAVPVAPEPPAAAPASPAAPAPSGEPAAPAPAASPPS